MAHVKMRVSSVEKVQIRTAFLNLTSAVKGVLLLCTCPATRGTCKYNSASLLQLLKQACPACRIRLLIAGLWEPSLLTTSTMPSISVANDAIEWILPSHTAAKMFNAADGKRLQHQVPKRSAPGKYLQASLIGVGGVVMLQEVVIQQLQQLRRWQHARELGTQQSGRQQSIHPGWCGCKGNALRLQEGQAGARQQLVQNGWGGGQAHDDRHWQLTMTLHSETSLQVWTVGPWGPE